MNPGRTTAMARPLSAARRHHYRAVLLPALVLLAVAVWQSPQWISLPIRDLQIQGQFRYLEPGQLRQLVRQAIGQRGFFDVDIAALRQRLLQEPWLREIRVQRLWPDGIRLYVTEQSAVARWGEGGALNERGEIFWPERSTGLLELPHLQGPEGQQALLFARLRLLQERALPGTGRHLERLQLSGRGAWTLFLSGDLQVKLGRTHFPERLQRALDLLRPAEAGWLSGVRTMDLRYPNGVALGFTTPGV